MQSNPLPSETAEILLAQPRGFCAGVDRAINIVNEALNRFGAPIYVRHEIVHNKYVVDELRAKGAIFVDEIDEIPRGAIVIYSAHGVSQQVRQDAAERGLQVYDATCPLVTKVHLEVQRFLKDGYQIVYIGHKGHIEGVGVLGEAPDVHIPLVESVEDVENLALGNPEKLVYLTQTTLSIDDTKQVIEALQKKYPQIVAPPLEDICFATTNQDIPTHRGA